MMNQVTTNTINSSILPQPARTATAIFSAANPTAVALSTRAVSTIPESVISVYCDLCSEMGSDTRAALTRAGWGVYSRECFCPVHESMV